MNQIAIDRSEATWKRHLLTLALAAFTALIVCYFLTLFIFTAHNDDQSWYLYAAHRVLGGAQISGPLLVETNPPLIIWFSVLPLALGHVLRLDPYVALKLIVFLLIGASTLWSARILRATKVMRASAILCISAASALGAEIFLNPFQFGQREHLVIILLLPYVFSSICGAKSGLSTAERCMLGLAAGLAICFKPQQALILVALEFSLAFWTRSVRRLIAPEFLCALLTIFAYIASVRLFAPLYLSRTLPLLRDTYWAYGPASTWSLIKSQPCFDFLFLAALFTFIWKRRSFAFPAAPGALLACALASSIAFYLQHVGATEAVACRDYPQHAFLLLAIAWIASDLVLATRPATFIFNTSFAAAAAVVALLLLPPFFIVGRMIAQAEPAVKKFSDSILAQCPRGTSVYMISPSPWEFPAVLQKHLRWASRAPCLWMLPAIVQNQLAETGGPSPGKRLPPETINKIASLQRTETRDDFIRWKPSLVIVEQCSKSHPCQGLAGIDFDLLAWLLQSPEFEAEWANYSLQESHDSFDVYKRIR